MSKTIIDLSHSISECMTVYPGSEKPGLRNVATLEKNGYNELSLTFSTHTGTHIDAPFHILAKGKTLDTYDVDTFYGKALIIDCLNIRIIESKVIKDSLQKREIPQFLLFRTGWDKFWETGDYFKNYPVLARDAAKYITQLPLNGIGIDAPSYDPLNSDDLPNHSILLKRGFILIENLCNLNRVDSKEILFSCFPLKIKGADGSPVRTVAICNKLYSPGKNNS